MGLFGRSVERKDMDIAGAVIGHASLVERRRLQDSDSIQQIEWKDLLARAGVKTQPLMAKDIWDLWEERFAKAYEVARALQGCVVVHQDALCLRKLPPVRFYVSPSLARAPVPGIHALQRLFRGLPTTVFAST